MSVLKPQQNNPQQDLPSFKWRSGVRVLIGLILVLVAGLVPAWYYFLVRPHPSQGDTIEQVGPSVETSPARTNEPLGVLRLPRTAEVWRADDETFDPAGDGWESESFVQAAQDELKKIVGCLVQKDKIAAETFAEFLAEDFVTQALRPSSLWQVAADKSIVVRRGPGRAGRESGQTYQGAEGLAQAFRILVGPLRDAVESEVHVKIHGVSITDSLATTTVDLEIHGRVADQVIQQNATWICHWARSPGKRPRLASIELADFEEVVGSATHGKWFSDCTQAVLSHNSSYHEQIVFGLNHWLRQIERVHRMQIYARTGLAVGDVNGDGLDDVYLCQPGGLPNRLYIQNPDGTATDMSQEAGVDWLDHTSSALLVDLDNDGDQDLAVSTTGGLLLMENDSTGRFSLRDRLDVERSAESLSAVDYDHDGDLDLYNCVYRADPARKHTGAAAKFVYHDANNGGVNRLFRNDISMSADGVWRMTDVTRQCGLDESNRRWSLAASWEDFDNDGDQDLYVANDYGQNCLYRNQHGHFVNVADEAGVVDFGSGMSVCWGDYNRDGWMDLYVGNMFSSAGNRIATQRNFKAGADQRTRDLYRRFAKGNSLFENIGGVRFREVGKEAALEMARWAWSSLFVDINNDGWEDVLVVNGFITADDPRDL